MRILIIASGGGHTGFARAIAQYLPEKADFVIPKNDEYSKLMIRDYANIIYEVQKGREPNESSIHFAKRIMKILYESSKLPKYDIIIATGSNHSIFPSFFQFLKGGKVFAIESQDRFITKGKAVDIISKFSKGVFLHWEEQRKLYKDKSIVVGPIVERPRYEPRDNDYILITAGSLGFKRLFDIASKITWKKIVIQTGKVDPRLYKKENVTSFSFDPDLEKWIANSSLVITHQGKTAMEAVVMYKKPVIIVYNKDWKSATTYEDAKIYAEVLGATFLDDPISWNSDEILYNALEKVGKPKEIKPGTPKLIHYLRDEENLIP